MNWHSVVLLNCLLCVDTAKGLSSGPWMSHGSALSSSSEKGLRWKWVIKQPQRSLGNDSSTPLSNQGRLPPWTTYTKYVGAAQDFCTVLYGIWENNCAALLDHFFSSSKWNTCISSVPALCSSLFSSAAALLSTVASLHLASSSSSSLHSSEGHNLH